MFLRRRISTLEPLRVFVNAYPSSVAVIFTVVFRFWSTSWSRRTSHQVRRYATPFERVDHRRLTSWSRISRVHLHALLARVDCSSCVVAAPLFARVIDLSRALYSPTLLSRRVRYLTNHHLNAEVRRHSKLRTPVVSVRRPSRTSHQCAERETR